MQEDSFSDIYLDSIFRNSPEAIVLLDDKNRVLRINREFERIFGFSSEDILGKHIDELIAGDEEKEEADRYSKMAERGESLTAESIRRRKDGSPVEVSILGAPVEEDGKVLGIFAIYRDISMRKQIERRLIASETRYRELFENAPIGIFQSSSRGHFLHVNMSVAEMLGFETPGEVVEYYTDLKTQFYRREEKRQELLSLLQLDGSVRNFEVEACRRDGTVIWLSINARISGRDNDGSFTLDGFIIDRTRLEKAEQKLYRSLNEKEVLLQEVHHRVKNNMQIISSLLNLETMNFNEGPARDMLLILQNRIQAMALVHEKLYGSDSIAEVNLAEYTRDLTLQILDVLSGDIRPTVTFELEDLQAGMDFSVPYGLIVNELVINAYRHAFKGIAQPRLFLFLTQSPTAVTLVVQDNGVGISGAHEKNDTGTLGMKLIDSLVTQLGGELSIRNEGGMKCAISFPSEKINGNQV